MSERRRQVQEIRALLQSRVLDLVRTVAPDGKVQAGYWIARNPTRDDRNPGSFYVWLTKAPGAWRDDATGDKGDIISLIQYTQGCDFKGAIAWASSWLNYERLPAAQVSAARAFADRNRAEDDSRAAQQLERNRKRAFACYLEAKKAEFLGSPVDAYLSSRGVNVARLARVPGALGWLDNHRHTETGTRFPVLLAAMHNSEGAIAAIHRTWIDHDGRDKAPVIPARKIWPSFAGCVVRLWRGETGVSVNEAARDGLLDTLAIVEGIEDGLSLAVACPELRVWCAGSLGNLKHIVLPACAHEVIVCADNDWGKPAAGRQLEQALLAMERQHKRIKVARAHVGKDVNDALRGQLDKRNVA